MTCSVDSIVRCTFVADVAVTAVPCDFTSTAWGTAPACTCAHVRSGDEPGGHSLKKVT